MRLCVAIDRDIGASWRTDQLIWHPNHRRNWTHGENTDEITFNIPVVFIAPTAIYCVHGKWQNEQSVVAYILTFHVEHDTLGHRRRHPVGRYAQVRAHLVAADFQQRQHFAVVHQRRCISTKHTHTAHTQRNAIIFDALIVSITTPVDGVDPRTHPQPAPPSHTTTGARRTHTYVYPSFCAPPLSLRRPRGAR